jgi:hypothetical protein
MAIAGLIPEECVPKFYRDDPRNELDVWIDTNKALLETCPFRLFGMQNGGCGEVYGRDSFKSK